MTTIKKDQRCSKCKGDNVTAQFFGWCSINKPLGTLSDDSVEWTGLTWCEDCEEHVAIEEVDHA